MPRKLVGPKAKKQVFGFGPQLTYHGGPLLTNVKVITVFWGSAWKNDPLQPMLDQFFDFVVTSSLVDQLGEYSVPGQTIGRGTHPFTLLKQDSEPGSTIDDSAIQLFLRAEIARGMLPAPDSNTVYFVFMPSGTTVTLQGQSSCTDFCGYHNATPDGAIVYAVDTYDDCPGCQFVPGDIVASSTVVASHEFCESITDPQLNAWFDDNTGQEIGDICEGSNKVINTFDVNAGLETARQAATSPTFSVGVSPSTAVIDGTQTVSITVTLTPLAGPPPPPPPPPPPTQNWTVQTEWSNAQGACV